MDEELLPELLDDRGWDVVVLLITDVELLLEGRWDVVVLLSMDVDTSLEEDVVLEDR